MIMDTMDAVFFLGTRTCGYSMRYTPLGVEDHVIVVAAHGPGASLDQQTPSRDYLLSYARQLIYTSTSSLRNLAVIALRRVCLTSSKTIQQIE